MVAARRTSRLSYPRVSVRKMINRSVSLKNCFVVSVRTLSQIMSRQEQNQNRIFEFCGRKLFDYHSTYRRFGLS